MAAVFAVPRFGELAAPSSAPGVGVAVLAFVVDGPPTVADPAALEVAPSIVLEVVDAEFSLVVGGGVEGEEDVEAKVDVAEALVATLGKSLPTIGATSPEACPRILAHMAAAFVSLPPDEQYAKRAS